DLVSPVVAVSSFEQNGDVDVSHSLLILKNTPEYNSGLDLPDVLRVSIDLSNASPQVFDKVQGTFTCEASFAQAPKSRSRRSGAPPAGHLFLQIAERLQP